MRWIKLIEALFPRLGIEEEVLLVSSEKPLTIREIVERIWKLRGSEDTISQANLNEIASAVSDHVKMGCLCVSAAINGEDNFYALSPRGVQYRRIRFDVLIDSLHEDKGKHLLEMSKYL